MFTVAILAQAKHLTFCFGRIKSTANFVRHVGYDERTIRPPCDDSTVSIV